MLTACSSNVQTTSSHVAARRPCAPRAFAAAPARSIKRSCLTRSTFQGKRVLSAAPSKVNRRAGSFAVHANAVTDVFKYLSEAAQSIFTTPQSDVDWEGTSSSFTGRITHHEELPRLRKLYQLVSEARQQVAGCTDPNATNFDATANVDDGTCSFTFVEGGQPVAIEGSVKDYVNAAIGRVVNNNFTGDKGGPDWENTTFNYAGDIVSQRDITRLLAFEKVVKSTLDKAEEEASKQ